MIPAPTWAPAQTELAPPGAASIRLCRYGGLNDRPRLRLAYQALLRKPKLVSHLTREFDALPSWPGGPTPHSCPSDDGSQILAIVRYAAGQTVTIATRLRGCLTVTNGSVTRTATGFGGAPQVGPQLERELARITHYRAAVIVQPG
jgi:hypothetical protein